MAQLKRPTNAHLTSSEGFMGYFTGAYFSSVQWPVYKVMVVAMLVVAIICSRIAMLNILALEFSSVIGLIVSHFTAILVIREFFRIKNNLAHRGPYTPGPHPRLVTWGVIAGTYAASLWLMLLPLIAITILGMIFSIRNCDPLTGIGFYLAIPLVSTFFASAIAAFCSHAASSRAKAGWLYVLVVTVFVGRILLRIGHGHVMSMNDAFLGILALPLYEQEANLDSGFVFSRGFLLVGSVLVVTLSVMLADVRFHKYSIKNLPLNFLKPDNYLPEIQAAIVLGILLILGFWYQGPLGMEITRNYLEHELDGRASTEHFVIYYPTGGEVEDDIERIAEQHEYYYWSIYNEIGVAPGGPIRAYIYPDRRTKTRLTGAGAGVYAKPWTGEIHVEYDRNRIRALKHELVHVISAPMGVAFFGSSLLGAYGEGIAEGVEWDTGNDLTYHQWAAALREADDPYSDSVFFPRETAPLLLLTRNFRPGGFYVGRISMNYYLSASQTKWFLETYGIEAYRIAYIRNNTEGAIGMTQGAAAEAWMEYLDHVPLRQEEIEYTRLAFSPQKFTVRACAHELAEHERLAGEYAGRTDWLKAADEYDILLDFSPNNVRYGYQKARMFYYAEEYSKAMDVINGIRDWETTDENWHSYLLILEGDIYARTNRAVMAEEAYMEAFELSLTASTRENVALRLAVLDSPGMEEFMEGFKEPDDARWRYEKARDLDDGWLPLYYLGSSLLSDRMYEEAQEVYLECLRLDPPYVFVRRNCLYYLGVCAYRAEEYSLARSNFQDAGVVAADIFLNEHPAYDSRIPLTLLDGWSVSCADWLERCDWRESWTGITISDE